MALVAAWEFNLSMLSYALWFMIAELVTVPAAVALGVFASPRRRRQGRSLIGR